MQIWTLTGAATSVAGRVLYRATAKFSHLDMKSENRRKQKLQSCTDGRWTSTFQGDSQLLWSSIEPCIEQGLNLFSFLCWRLGESRYRVWRSCWREKNDIDTEQTFQTLFMPSFPSSSLGTRKKDAGQIAGLESAYLAIDDIESGYDNVVPLWSFGFLYWICLIEYCYLFSNII